MRIVAGRFKGRRIEAPQGDGTRPTTDRVREALMSSIISAWGAPLDGVRALDAFAGSGALGLEALSRGAASCCFFERDPKALRVLKQNIVSLGMDPTGKLPAVTAEQLPVCAVIRGDAFKVAAAGAMRLSPYDLVLMDPPYAVPAAQVLGFMQQLASSGSLAQGALCVYEHRQGSFDPASVDAMEGFKFCGIKDYGITAVAIMCFTGKDGQR
ncbi:MAG: 16S rRNA (guanine(966)-N(2))-methyltransferase RsmD [Coriobacteriales bacterium]|nr:16S rRNA (guanine(966)-N(2))-methyltransferase RsmD [Coriobacteriales bacterium]